LKSYRGWRTEGFAVFMAKMGRIRKTRGVCRDSEIVAFYDLTYCLSYSVPSSVTAERNADLLRKQVLKP
jgi:hypothetical protein